MLELEENIKYLNNLKSKLLEISKSMKLSNLKEDVSILEKETLEPNFWNDAEKSSTTFSKLKSLQRKINNYTKLETEVNNLIEMNELLQMELDEHLVKELLQSSEKLEKEIEKLEIETLFSGKYDNNNAIITLHPGAGGTESQDWVQMLYRMYGKWASSNGFSLKELDYLPGDEAGIKSVTALVSGENAYGYLKCEMGVHRLVRISPFDSGGRRHTSFASLEVLPEITDDIEIEIDQNDLRIDTYRASGAGRTAHKQNRFCSQNYSYTNKYCGFMSIRKISNNE